MNRDMYEAAAASAAQARPLGTAPTPQGPITYIAGCMEEMEKDLIQIGDRFKYIADNLGLQEETSKDLASATPVPPPATTIGDRLMSSTRAIESRIRFLKRQLLRLENM